MGRSWWSEFLPTLLIRFPNLKSLYLDCNYISPYKNNMFPFCQLPVTLEYLYLKNCQDHVYLSDMHLLPNLKLIAVDNYVCPYPKLCNAETIIVPCENLELVDAGYKIIPKFEIQGLQRLMKYRGGYCVYMKN